MAETGRNPSSEFVPADSNRKSEPPPLPAEWVSRSAAQRSTRPPGPGLFEAAFWVAGMAMAQIVGVVVVLGIFIAALILPGGGVEPAAVSQSLQNPVFLAQLEEHLNVPLFAGSQVIFVAIVLIAARARLGRQIRRLLATNRLLPSHAVLIVLAVLPVSILSTKTYIWFTTAAWEPLKAHYQWLAGFDELNSMAMLSDMAQTTPVWILLLAMAVAPALGEELVFRGVVGRGLLARWGIPAGVLITSVMFAAMHLHPAHVVGVIPLGIAMHFVYLATRSFWAPVLFHFLNNAIAVFSAKLFYEAADAGAADVGMKVGLTPVDLSLGWVLASVSCAAAIGLRLWRTRVRYTLPDGAQWSPGYNSVEAPPANVDVCRITAAGEDRTFALVVASVLVFVTAWYLAAGGV